MLYNLPFLFLFSTKNFFFNFYFTITNFLTFVQLSVFITKKYTLTLSNTVWLHEYVLTAWDAEWNTTAVTITYNVVADSVTNVNITGYTVSSLTNDDLTLSWTTDIVPDNSEVQLFSADGTYQFNKYGKREILENLQSFPSFA